jgi:hypothetical protein
MIGKMVFASNVHYHQNNHAMTILAQNRRTITEIDLGITRLTLEFYLGTRIVPGSESNESPGRGILVYDSLYKLAGP